MSIKNIGIYQTLIVQLDKLARHNRQGSYKTRERYYAAMKRFCAYLADAWHTEKLSNIASKHLVGYIAYLQESGHSPSTIKTDLCAIRFFHDRIGDTRFTLPDNSELDLTRRTVRGIDRTWSNSEFNLMLIEAKSCNREEYITMFCLARYAGLRLEECLRLDTSTAEKALKSGYVTVKGKNGKIRMVPINETIRIELKHMLELTQRGHKLFVTEGEPTDLAKTRVENFIYNHRKAAQDANRSHPITFHGLRHTYACRMYQELISKGNDHETACKQVSKLLGHERGNVTMIYLASLKKEGFDVS